MFLTFLYSLLFINISNASTAEEIPSSTSTSATVKGNQMLKITRLRLPDRNRITIPWVYSLELGLKFKPGNIVITQLGSYKIKIQWKGYSSYYFTKCNLLHSHQVRSSIQVVFNIWTRDLLVTRQQPFHCAKAHPNFHTMMVELEAYHE